MSKMLGLGEARKDLSNLVREAQREKIIITVHGRPKAVLVGVEGLNLDQIMLTTVEALQRLGTCKYCTAIWETHVDGVKGMHPHGDVCVDCDGK